VLGCCECAVPAFPTETWFSVPLHPCFFPIPCIHALHVLSCPASCAAACQSGWSPHRDRPATGPDSFREDGTPRYLTAWVALTDATPETSCLYVLPAPQDEGYYASGAVTTRAFSRTLYYTASRLLRCERASWVVCFKLVPHSASRSIAVSNVAVRSSHARPPLPPSVVPRPASALGTMAVTKRFQCTLGRPLADRTQLHRRRT
jgi:hypothetical protein